MTKASSIHRAGAWLLAVAVLGCGESASEAPSTAPSSARATPSAARLPAGAPVLPPREVVDENPLRLARDARPAPEGAKVWAVPRRMLVGAKEGSTLALEHVRVTGSDGASWVVRPRRGPSYRVHPGYVIVPDRRRMRRRLHVIAPLRGRLRHGLLVTLRRDAAIVRFFDVGRRLPDQRIAPSHIGVLQPGLVPGAYAAHRRDGAHHQVLLVSKQPGEGGRSRWFTLDHYGAAHLVPEAELSPMPQRLRVKSGAAVWVAWRGQFVPAKVKAVDQKTLFTVSRARLGPSLVVGPGSIMLPADG